MRIATREANAAPAQVSASPAVAPAGPSRRLPDLALQAAEARFTAFRETMLRILRDTSLIAEAARTNGGFALRGFGGITDPEATPIRIRGISEHFVVKSEDEVLHAMYTSVAPDRLDQLSPVPQLLLVDLVDRIRAMNLYCQQAERDEALGVALQSPGVAAKIDRILILSAFFAGYFENLVTAGAVAVGMPGKLPSAIDLGLLEASLKRHLLMATDRMLEPDRAAGHMPAVGWPHLGAEVLRRGETGDTRVNGVYLPALYARQMAAKAARESNPKARPPGVEALDLWAEPIAAMPAAAVA
jgi:hypothetical protein